MHAIVMAGGRGTRLGDAANGVPKVLVKLDNEYDILGTLIAQLNRYGYRRITLCVAHLADMVAAAVAGYADGLIDIDLCVDGERTGTAGPLHGVERFDQPALVVNGDLLVDMDFAAIYAQHVRRGAALTVATVPLPVPLAHGVLDVVDGRVAGIAEKPSIEVTISAGVYVVSPAVLPYLATEAIVDMPDLVARLVNACEAVDAYPFDGDWYDVGTVDGLTRARAAFAAGRDRFVITSPAARPGDRVAHNATPRPGRVAS